MFHGPVAATCSCLNSLLVLENMVGENIQIPADFSPSSWNDTGLNHGMLFRGCPQRRSIRTIQENNSKQCWWFFKGLPSTHRPWVNTPGPSVKSHLPTPRVMAGSENFGESKMFSRPPNQATLGVVGTLGIAEIDLASLRRLWKSPVLGEKWWFDDVTSSVSMVFN